MSKMKKRKKRLKKLKACIEFLAVIVAAIGALLTGIAEMIQALS